LTNHSYNMKKILFAALVVAAFQGCDYTQLQEVYNPNSCPGDTTYLTTTVLNNETGAPFPGAKVTVTSTEIVCFWACSFPIASGLTNADGTYSFAFEYDTSRNVYYTAEIRSPNDSFGPMNMIIRLDKGCTNDFSVPLYRQNTVNAIVMNNTTDSITLYNLYSKVDNLYAFSWTGKEYLSARYINERIPPSGVKLYRLNGLPNQTLTISARLGEPHGSIDKTVQSSADTAITVNFLIK
jgi:hypothetical protein